MSSITRSLTLGAPIASTDALYLAARRLVKTGLDDHPEETQISLLAVGVSGLSFGTALQLELPLDFGSDVLQPGSERGRRHHDIDRAMDRVRDRFGKEAVAHANTALSPDKGMVEEEFRRLAQRS